jgi:hypothetical protein
MNGQLSVPIAARAAALPSVAAGLLWVVAWAHLLLAHGTGQVNEQRIAFGLTWLDSGRLAAPALLLGAVAIWMVARTSDDAGLRVAGSIAIVGLSGAATGAALGFWTQPVGTYVGASRTAGIAVTGGLLAMAGSVAVAVGLVAVGLTAGRAGIVPGWVAVLLGVAGVSTVPWLHESPQGVVFGIAWLVIGAFLAWPARFGSRIAGRVAGALAIGSGLAYLMYPFTADVAITAWNVLIVPAFVWLGGRTAHDGRVVALASTTAGVAASLLWAVVYHEPSLETWWIGLAAASWMGFGWLLRRRRQRLAAFTLVLGIAAAVDFVLTALNAPFPLYALGGFKLPFTMIWTFWIGWTLVRDPLLDRQ